MTYLPTGNSSPEEKWGRIFKGVGIIWHTSTELTIVNSSTGLSVGSDISPAIFWAAPMDRMRLGRFGLVGRDLGDATEVTAVPEGGAASALGLGA